MSGTYISKIPVLVVALVIGIVLVTSAVVPLASDYSDAKTFKNVGYYDMTYTEENSVTAVWDHTKPNEITINETSIPLTTADQFLPKTILCGDDWLIRYSNGGQSIGFFIQYYGPSGASILASESEAADMTITCASNSYSIATTHSTPKTASGSYTYLYCVSDNGDFVMKNSTEAAYVNGDTPILAMGTSNVGNVPSVGISIEGTIDLNLMDNRFRGTGISFSNENATYSDVSNYKNLYTIEKLTATASDGGTNTTDLTYNYFIIPAEVTADPDNPTAYKNLVKVVPLMAFIMLVVAAAGMVYLKNKD